MELLRDYQSTELVYERICSALKELDTTVTVAQVRSLETSQSWYFMLGDE